MAAHETEVPPAQDPKIETDEGEGLSEEDEIPEHLRTKSGVSIDPNPANQTGRFNRSDVVHRSEVVRGVRTKGIYTVSKGRLHSSGAYYEYQLVDGDNRPYKNGAWIREKELRMERRSG